MWLFCAFLSALFAGITSVLSKCGIKNTGTNTATAIRTTVVLAFSWLMVFITGAQSGLASVSPRSWLFLTLSGLATGASWICYFKALSLGEASKVAAIDKSSVIITLILALVLFPNERVNLWLKIFLIAIIGAGTLLMADIKKSDGKKSRSYIVFAALSAVFAAATSILAKIGIENVNSNAATAIRTCVVFIMAWGIAAARGELREFKKITLRDTIFLILSGLATGASWLFYYYSIQKGQVSVVVPIDKLSILFTVLFSRLALKERLSPKSTVGLILLTSGTLLMAAFA